MHFDLRLWRMTAGLRGRIAIAVGLGLLSLAVGIARFAFLGVFLAAVLRGTPIADALWLLGAAAGAILLRAALDHSRTIIAHRTAATVQHRLRQRLFDKIVALGPAWFGAERTGGVMLSMVDGVEQLQTFFGQYLPQVCIALVAPIAIFAFIAFWDVPVAAVMLAGALFSLVMPAIVHARSGQASRGRQAAFKSFGEEFLDGVQGLPTLKAFGQSAAYGRMLAAKARALSRGTFWVLSLSVATRGLTDLGTALGAAIALVLGAWRVRHGDMSLEALLIVLVAGTEIFRPLRDLRGVLHQGLHGESAAAGLTALLAADETAPRAPTARRSAPLTPELTFEDVRFAYPGGRQAAHNGLTLTVGQGERVGIVGPSGSGKSSVVRLLLRLHDPQSGVIRLGGVDIRELDPATVRGMIAVVNQDTTLFHGTVAENLRLGRPDATEAELHAAAAAANADAFIAALPDGYETVIGERGARLSGGQRQRLAIARALLRDAPILILDEALSSVDAENEATIQQALDRLMRGRTTLILAHRLSSVIGADRILVLDEGAVVQAGNHAALIRQDGPYRRLMAPQLDSGATAGSLDTAWTALDAGATRTATNAADTLPRGRVPSSDGPRTAAGSGGAGTAAGSGDGGKAAGSGDGGTAAGSGDGGTAARFGDPTGEGVAVTNLSDEAASVSWPATIRTLLQVVRPYRGQLAVTVLCGIGRVVAFIGVGALGALLIGAVRDGRAGTGLAVALLVAAPVAALLHWVESWIAHAMAYNLLAEMRIELFRKLDALAPAYLLRRRSGDLVALATQDVETVEYFFAHTIAPAVVAALVPAAVLGLLASVAWPLALLLAPFLLYAAASPVLGRRRIDTLASAARGALGLVGAHVTETIQGMAELAAFNATERRRAMFLQSVEAYQQRRLRLLGDLSLQSAALEVATGLGGLAVAGYGAVLVQGGLLTPALLPLLVLVSVAAFMPVSEIAQVGRQLADTIASTRRLHVVHAEPEVVRDGPLDAPAPVGGSALTLDAVRFTYPGRSRPALRDVSFAVAPGATVALVGPSGAGKTTIANLLLRFWDPDGGAIRIDGIDLRDLRLDGLRARIALVAQDTYLFNDTLLANVRLARPDATEDQVRQALNRASLSEFVASLPDGLATRVGERGVALSGGQRQRIAIARAFLKDAPLLVLDEATSHLDTISEAAVRSALTALMADRTTIVVAHRLSTIREADLIVVMRDGAVAEAGRHGALLSRRGVYARLVEHQVAGVAGQAAAD